MKETPATVPASGEVTVQVLSPAGPNSVLLPPPPRTVTGTGGSAPEESMPTWVSPVPVSMTTAEIPASATVSAVPSGVTTARLSVAGR